MLMADGGSPVCSVLLQSGFSMGESGQLGLFGPVVVWLVADNAYREDPTKSFTEGAGG